MSFAIQKKTHKCIERQILEKKRDIKQDKRLYYYYVQIVWQITCRTITRSTHLQYITGRRRRRCTLLRIWVGI